MIHFYKTPDFNWNLVNVGDVVYIDPKFNGAPMVEIRNHATEKQKAIQCEIEIEQDYHLRWEIRFMTLSEAIMDSIEFQLEQEAKTGHPAPPSAVAQQHIPRGLNQTK